VKRKRRICVVTGSRAEYGLLRWLMEEIERTPSLQLQVIATGMHLSPEFGLTYREIECDGFRIDCKVEMLLSSDTPMGLAKSMGLGLIGFADAFQRLQPDVLVLLGDRFEIFAAAAAATVARIPMAHIHGGEVTQGAFDEPLRHAITKMAHLHFVAAEEYRRRVIQLGEAPERVYLVGALGLDGIKRLRLLDREGLEQALDFKLGARSLLVTFHPVTLEPGASKRQMSELLAALARLENVHLIITMPNADTDGRAFIDMIEDFTASHANARAYTSLGQLRYLSCLRYVDGVVGNSSSGLIEAPAFRKGTVNIGDRQRGRLKAASVIDCEPERGAILEAIRKLYSREFQEQLHDVRNPYGEGDAAVRIARVLGECALDSTLLKKGFYDLKR